MTRTKILHLLFASTAAIGSTAIVAVPAMAQTSIASIRGQVSDSAGAPVAGATVVAVSAATNQTLRTTANAAGGYTLTGLRPGSYTVTITAASGETFKQVVVVGIGEAASLDATLGTATAAAEPSDGAEIVVTGSRLRETKTSEVATNVSQQQIRSLPQTDRNFLSFAALAPGVRYNDSETDKGFQSGASTASQVNVFIDGVSLKNQSREGGVAGQQNSRGNPFGQSAVQEFRVLTQNYKAEYEQAGAAIITAITKSGSNEFHGEVFGQYTDKGLSEKAYLDKLNNRPEPAFKRKQYGVSLGGPIIKDKLFFFGAFEGNDQDRAFNVAARGTPAVRAAVEASSGRKLSDLEGAFVSPFRGKFYFGKLTFTPDEHQVFDVSASRRQESDIQGFGDTTSFETAENKRNTVDTYLFKWTYNGDGFVNEFNTNYLNYTFNPTALNPNLPTREYDGVITFGGKNSTRKEIQTNYTIRDDLTYTGFNGHTFKLGGRVDVADFKFDNRSYIQPDYVYRLSTTDNTDYSFPAEARLGLGQAVIRSSDTQIGFYAQDDWQVTRKLTLNLGVRWDYETNGFNNDYVTPAAAASALRALPKTFYFDPENYISTGKNRKPFAGAFAPRFGFSYDIGGDQRTVIFGGVGRYYDRNNFNNTIDELSRTINPIGVFRFSRDGQPRSGLPTTMWNPSYGTREGLLALIASSRVEGLPELFAVKNNAKPPVNDQASLGIRQKLGVWQVSVTGSYIKGRNGYTNLFATRTNNGLGNCCNTAPVIPFGYANALIGYDGAQWSARAGRAWSDRWGDPHLAFPPLFGHQYSHVWVDFRGIRDPLMTAKGIDYFENSRRATYAQRAYAIANPGGFAGYGADCWGLTACDGSGDFAIELAGKRREFFSYSARGPGDRDDGTIAPTAALGSIAFAPEIVEPAVRAMHRRYGAAIYQRYGFMDSFNPTLTAAAGPLQHGRIVPGIGWVDGDHLGIDQGPIVTMIENRRTGMIWRTMRRNAHLRRGLALAGFGGGWLA